MGIFKKKPQKKWKAPVKKMLPAVKKTPPKQWVPPFPGAGLRQKTKPVDDTNTINTTPELVRTEPTYILPPHEEAEPTISESSKPEKTVNPRDMKSRKEFMKTFRELTYRWRSWDIWTDFITMAACAISNSVDKVHFDEREALYLRTINKYNKEEQQLFPELFAHLVMALEENQEQDFLGEVYTELGLNSKEHQQVFTPYHVAHLMAKISIENIEKEIDDKGFVTVHDCCCGGGVTLIAAANVVKEKLAKTDLNYQNHLLVTGQDIDPVVAMMCYIQMSLLGIAGYFKVGNALTEPMSSSDSLDNYWFTPMYFFPVWRYRRIFHSLDNMLQAEPDTLKGENL